MEKKKNYVVPLIVSVVLLGVYYFINTFLIKDMNQIINYVFLLLVFGVLFRTVYILCNDKYAYYDRKYIEFLDGLRFFHYWFGRDRYIFDILRTSVDELSNEANNTLGINKSRTKTMFIMIRIGILLFVTTIWYLIINKNTFLANDQLYLPLFIAGMSIAILCFLLFPMTLAMRTSKQLADDIVKRKEQEKKANN